MYVFIYFYLIRNVFKRCDLEHNNFVLNFLGFFICFARLG
jgi:hypothetical protein